MRRWRELVVDLTPLRRSREFRLLYAGIAVSGLGSRLTDVAVPFQVYDLTGSTLAVGLLGLATLVPRFALSLVGGALADRYDRRRLLLVAELGGLGCSVGLLLNALTPEPRVWLVYLLAAASASFLALATPAATSALPLLLPKDQITAAAAIRSLAYSGTWLLGPAFAGVLLAVGGPEAAFAGDVVSFGLALAAMAAMRPIRPVASGSGSTLASVVEGLRALRGRAPLQGAFLMDLNAMVFGMPMALFPAIADERFGGSAVAFGLLMSAPFAGSLVASATSGWTRNVHRHGAAITAAVVVWGAAMVVFGLVHGLAATLGALALAGAADMVSGVFRQSVLSLATPPELLGRMEGVGMAVWTTGPALGNLEAGTVAALTSVTTSVVSGGLLCIGGAFTLVALLPGFRRYDVRAALGDVTREPGPVASAG